MKFYDLPWRTYKNHDGTHSVLGCAGSYKGWAARTIATGISDEEEASALAAVPFTHEQLQKIKNQCERTLESMRNGVTFDFNGVLTDILKAASEKAPES
jgi:hypothetical protein